jgi:hypothetical protein
MKKQCIFIKSFISAIGVFLYVSGVAWLGFNSQYIFGQIHSFLIPLLALLLFVISACITGLLVLGKPVYLYLEGHKKEAFILFFATLGWLVFFLLVLIIILLSK